MLRVRRPFGIFPFLGVVVNVTHCYTRDSFVSVSSLQPVQCLQEHLGCWSEPGRGWYRKHSAAGISVLKKLNVGDKVEFIFKILGRVVSILSLCNNATLKNI